MYPCPPSHLLARLLECHMIRYLMVRLLWMIPVLFGASIVMFLTVKLIPGDPALAILGPLATEEGLRRIREELGLNLPLYQQYFTWLVRMIQGDFGISVTTHVPVAQLVWPKYWNTLILASRKPGICRCNRHNSGDYLRDKAILDTGPGRHDARPSCWRTPPLSGWDWCWY